MKFVVVSFLLLRFGKAVVRALLRTETFSTETVMVSWDKFVAIAFGAQFCHGYLPAENVKNTNTHSEKHSYNNLDSMHFENRCSLHFNDVNFMFVRRCWARAGILVLLVACLTPDETRLTAKFVATIMSAMLSRNGTKKRRKQTQQQALSNYQENLTCKTFVGIIVKSNSNTLPLGLQGYPYRLFGFWSACRK